MLEKDEIKEEVNADTLPANQEGQEQQITPSENNDVVDNNPTDVEVDSNEQVAQNEEVAQQDEQVEPVQPRTFTQEEVNELIGKTRNEARNRANSAYYGRYGVDNDDELNELVGRGQSYKVLEDKYNTNMSELESLRAENALLKSGIVPSRYDDVKFILKGKGLEITPETISQELVTHPEWVNSISGEVSEPQPQQSITTPTTPKMFTMEMAEQYANTPKTPATTPQPNVVTKLGNTIPEVEDNNDSEAERVLKMFGI